MFDRQGVAVATKTKTGIKTKVGIGLSVVAISCILGGTSALLAAGIVSVANQQVNGAAVPIQYITITEPKAGAQIKTDFNIRASYDVTSLGLNRSEKPSIVVVFTVDNKQIYQFDFGANDYPFSGSGGSSLGTTVKVANLKPGQHVARSALFITKLGKILPSQEVSFTLLPGTCGNRIQEVGEQCDDGNTVKGDRCNATCQFEGSLVVSGQPPIPVAKSVVAGSKDVLVRTWKLDATNSVEDVHIKSLAVQGNVTGSGISSAWSLKIGSVVLATKPSPIGNLYAATSTFVFATPLIIPRGTARNIDLYVDVLTTAKAGNGESYQLPYDQPIDAFGMTTGSKATILVDFIRDGLLKIVQKIEAPSDLAIRVVGTDSAPAAWLTWKNNNTFPVGIVIERREIGINGPSGPFVELIAVSEDRGEYTDPVKAGHSYSYRIYNFDGLIDNFDSVRIGPYSNEATVKMPPELPLTFNISTEHVLGAQNAKVTIIEFADLSDPFSAKLQPVIKKVIQEYPNDVRLVYRHFPLTEIYPKSSLAAESAECVYEQKGNVGFFAYIDAILGMKGSFGGQFYIDNAKKIGVDEKKFIACIDGRAYQQKVTDARDLAKSFGVLGTPTMYINKQKIPGSISYESLKQIIQQELAR